MKASEPPAVSARQWHIFRADYGESYAPLESPDGYAPFAVTENGDGTATVWFAKYAGSDSPTARPAPR